MKKRNSILSSAISVALLSAFLGGCSGDNPESLIASSKDFLANLQGIFFYRIIT